MYKANTGRIPILKKCNFFFDRNRHDRLGIIHCKHRSLCLYNHFTQEEYKQLGEHGNDLVDCPRCKGTGIQKISAYGLNTPSNVTEFMCIDCNGEKKVVMYKTLLQRAQLRNWCTCKRETETQYYADGRHPKCKKHCWICLECNGFTQIG